MRSMLFWAMTLFVARAWGQECPATVEVKEAESISVRALVGMDLIEGELRADENGEAVPAPRTDAADDAYWEFRGPVGANVLWMRCYYRGTKVRITRRVNAEATGCRQSQSKVRTRESLGDTGMVRPVVSRSRHGRLGLHLSVFPSDTSEFILALELVPGRAGVEETYPTWNSPSYPDPL